MSVRIHTFALPILACICALAFVSTAAGAPLDCRCSKGGSTIAALGEEFPELVQWPLSIAALGEEFPEFLVWWLPTVATLGEEFPERVRLPQAQGLGEEFPE